MTWTDTNGSNEDTSLKFCLNRSNVDFLSTARDLVEDFLVSHNVGIVFSSAHLQSYVQTDH